MEATIVEISAYELERGKPMPSINHSAVQANTVFELQSRYRAQHRILSEANIEVAGRVMVPDIGIFQKMVLNMRHDHIVAPQLPLTTIEILSPTQALDDLIDKTTAYFQAGVQSCWIVVPKAQGVFLYHSPDNYTYYHHDQILTDPATGIELPLGPLFE